MNNILIIVGFAFLLIISGCSEYNFYHIFPFGQDLHKRSSKLINIQGYECTLSKQEFASLKSTINHCYPNWKILEKKCYFYSNGVAIGNDFFGDTSFPVLYAIGRGFKIDGRLPVIIYFTEKQKMLFFIAEDGML